MCLGGSRRRDRSCREWYAGYRRDAACCALFGFVRPLEIGRQLADALLDQNRGTPGKCPISLVADRIANADGGCIALRDLWFAAGHGHGEVKDALERDDLRACEVENLKARPADRCGNAGAYVL